MESEQPRFADETFTGLEPGQLSAVGAIFLGCHFEDCDLTELDLSRAHLAECTFERCELALAKFQDTILQDVTFDGCRLTGINFSVIAQGAMGVQAAFRDCDLSFCSFHRLDLTDCKFSGSVFRESDFRRCELSKVSFDDCDLNRCVFQQNDLTFADLRTARNYVISAYGNRIRGMQVALPEALSLLTAIEVDVQ